MNFRYASAVVLLLTGGEALAQQTPNPWLGDWRVENNRSARFSNVEPDRERGNRSYKILRDGDGIRIVSMFELFEQGWHTVTDSGKCDGQWHKNGGTALQAGSTMCRVKEAGVLEMESKNADGNQIIRRTWRISQDGRAVAALTEGDTPQRGKYRDVEYLIKWQLAYYGKWKMLPERATGEQTVTGVLLEPTSAGIKSTVYRKDGTTTSWETNLFGKEAPVQGGQGNIFMSALWMSQRSFEVTGKRDGKIAYRYKRTVSPSGQRMTTVGYFVNDAGVTMPYANEMMREQ